MKKHIKMFESFSNAGDHGYDKIEKFLKETTGKFTFEELEDAIIKIVGSADVTVGVDKKDKTFVFDLNDGTSGHGSVDIDDDGKITLPAKSVYYEDEPEPVDDTNEGTESVNEFTELMISMNEIITKLSINNHVRSEKALGDAVDELAEKFDALDAANKKIIGN